MHMVTIEHDGAVPVWVQLTDILRARIESGELASGKLIPSIRSLCQQYEVADGTVKRALAKLREEGLADSIPGRGWYVV